MATSPTPLMTPNHEWIVIHRCRELEHPIEFRIVLVGAALEPRPERLVARGVELPPGALEVEQRTVAFGQLSSQFGHVPMVACREAGVEDGRQ